MKPSSIERLSDVGETTTQWLWCDRIPFGSITVLDGDPGLRKSTLLIDLAARLTVAESMPGDDGASDAGNVLILSAEDSFTTVIKPRLLAAGGDPYRVFTPGADGPTVTLGDGPALAALVQETESRLLIIDPVVAYLGATTNSWNDQNVRAALRPVSEMAASTGAAVVLVRHLRKSGRDKAVLAGGGSIVHCRCPRCAVGRRGQGR